MIQKKNVFSLALIAVTTVFISGCFQQGLVSNKVANENGINEQGGAFSFSSSSNSSENPDPVATIKSEVTGQGFVKTSFADTSQFNNSTPSPINGFKLNGNHDGAAYCISNEVKASDTTSLGTQFDSGTQCYKPLSPNNDSPREDQLLEALGKDDASGIPFVLQALQLSFSNKTNIPTDKNYSKVNFANLKIKIKTAPIAIESSGKLRWDDQNIKTLTYGNSGCSLTSANTVGFDLNNMSLGTKDKVYYFLTGLWVFERSDSKPFESNHANPFADFQPTSGGGTQPGLNIVYSTRTKVYGSFILPTIINDEPNFLFFPGKNNDGTVIPSGEPDPEPFTFGRYRQQDSLPEVSVEAIPDDQFTSMDGVLVTPEMGRRDSNTSFSTSSGEIGDWKNRAIISICISGTRDVYLGQDEPASATNGKPGPPYPLVHALKYELRKLTVKIK